MGTADPVLAEEGPSFQRVTLHGLQQKKQASQKIVAITCYDATMARMVSTTGVDVVLVGDSLGGVMMGYHSTLPVTLEHMLHHCGSVARALRGPLLVGDMPFLSYHGSFDQTLHAARLMVQQGGAEAIKMEGASQPVRESMARLVDVGIPVMGHLGYTPQNLFHGQGASLRQGDDEGAADRIVEEAKALEKAGAFALVLELVPQELAAHITLQLSVPVIGIGSGKMVDGQILVLQDLLGMNPEFQPRFLKVFADLNTEIRGAVKTYAQEVRQGQFPGPEHSFSRSEHSSS